MTTTSRAGLGEEGGNDDNENNDYSNIVVDDEEATNLMNLLGHADSDVEEVQTQSRSMEQVDIFTAGSTGRDAFSKVADKEPVAVQIFQEIKSVSDAIVETLVISANDNSLCGQFLAMASGIDALFKALRLSKLIQRALDTVRKILAAFIDFINKSWFKFQNFFDQFDAGKKLERFTNGIKNTFGKGGKLGGKIGKVFG